MEDVDINEGNNENLENDREELWQKQKREREEYTEKLTKWLDEIRIWHYTICANLFPFRIEQIHELSVRDLQQGNIGFNPVVDVPNLGQPQANLQHLPNELPLIHTHQNGNIPILQNANPFPSTCEFVIPPLWKRMVAELMDFLILFLVKMALTFFLLESFDIIDVEFYGFESFQKNLGNPEVAVPMAMELLTLELLHRLIVCAYETVFLKGKLCATPGKRYMGLMVVTAESLNPIPGGVPERIIATAAKPLGWQKSLARAALKNIFIGLLLPLCVAFFIFPNNRTSYDMMSNSLVVEYQQEFMAYNAAA